MSRNDTVWGPVSYQLDGGVGLVEMLQVVFSMVHIVKTSYCHQICGFFSGFGSLVCLQGCTCTHVCAMVLQVVLTTQAWGLCALMNISFCLQRLKSQVDLNPRKSILYSCNFSFSMKNFGFHEGFHTSISCAVSVINCATGE